MTYDTDWVMLPLTIEIDEPCEIDGPAKISKLSNDGATKVLLSGLALSSNLTGNVSPTEQNFGAFTLNETFSAPRTEKIAKSATKVATSVLNPIFIL